MLNPCHYSTSYMSLNTRTTPVFSFPILPVSVSCFAKHGLVFAPLIFGDELQEVRRKLFQVNYHVKDLDQLVSMLQLAIQSSPTDPLIPFENLSYSSVVANGNALDSTPFASSRRVKRDSVRLNDTNFDPELFLEMKLVRLTAVVALPVEVRLCFFAIILLCPDL